MWCVLDVGGNLKLDDSITMLLLGAGISVQAGIPDFRSQEGLFQSLKKDNPTLSSGKDLFDASVFNVSYRVYPSRSPHRLKNLSQLVVILLRTANECHCACAGTFCLTFGIVLSKPTCLLLQMRLSPL